MERGKGIASEAVNEQFPSIFISHSGHQKPGFVTHLYHALRHANYLPFFDIDPINSLPRGCEYPPRIFQACQACQMGLIVLSKDYITSLWPMLELQHLMSGPSSHHRRIYPLFYELQPADLSNSINLTRWKEYWEEKEANWQQKMSKLHHYMSSNGWELEIGLDTSLWAENLEKLQYRSGDIRNVNYLNDGRTRYQSDYDYIQAIVSNLCTLLPPPPRKYLLSNDIKGEERMAQEIAQEFEQAGSLGADGVAAMGVHGIGGSGKTTLCKMMTNFFTKEFCGRCFYVELATKDDEVEKQLLGNIKAILKVLSPGRHSSKIDHVDQALGLLQEGLHTSKVFLAIDNVWGHVESKQQNFDFAKRIMLMKCLPGSKLLTTSRMKRVLTCLLQERLNTVGNIANREHSNMPPAVRHVPSLSEAEAMEAIKSYSCFSSSIPERSLRSLATSCFFQGQCHPLYLKLKGVELQRQGRASFNGQIWEGLISKLEKSDGGNAYDHNPDNSEKAVQLAVERSLDILPSHLQDLFIDLAAWLLYTDLDVLGLWSECAPTGEDYLCFHYNDGTKDAMFYKVLELEYYGLLEVNDAKYENRCWGWGWGWGSIAGRLVIHDLHKLAAESRISLPHTNPVLKHVFGRGNLSRVPTSDLASKKLVNGKNLKASALKTLFASRKASGTCFKCMTPPIDQVQIQVLIVDGICERATLRLGRSSLNLEGGNMQALRCLCLRWIKGIREIKGWEGVRNLVWLELNRLTGLERIGPLGCLERLEGLVLVKCKNLQVQGLVGAGSADRLINPTKRRSDYLPKLQVLHIEDNVHLVEVGPVLADTFPTLQRLIFENCPKLEWYSNLKLGNLRILQLRNCPLPRRSVEGSIWSLPALQDLELDWDVSGRRFSRNVANECNPLRGLVLNVTNHLEKMILNSVGTNDGSGATSVLSLLQDVVCCCDDDQIGHPQTPSGSPFVNLQHLQLSNKSVAEEVSGLPCLQHLQLDVSGLPCLQILIMQHFESVQKLSLCSNSLVKLRFLRLENFPNLEEISGLGAGHTSLQTIRISNCPTLVRIPGFHALPCLQVLYLWRVANDLALSEYPDDGGSSDNDRLGPAAIFPVSLERLQLEGCSVQEFLASDLAALSSLTVLSIGRCSAMIDVSSVATLPSLADLEIIDCSALTDISGLANLTSLRYLSLQKCTSLINIPDLRHLTRLERVHISDPRPPWTLSEEALRQMVNESCNVFIEF